MMPPGDDRIVALLEAAGKIDPDKKKRALQFSDEQGMRPRDAMVSLGFVGEDDIIGVLASELGMENIRLGHARINQEVIEVFSREVADKYKAIPCAIEDGIVTVALADPFDVQAQDYIRIILEDKGLIPKFVLAREDEIHAAIERFYTGETEAIQQQLSDLYQAEAQKAANEAMENAPETTSAQLMAQIDVDDVEQNDAPIVRLLNLILQEALRARASDVHVEPYERALRVRFRIDGVLHDMQAPHKKLQNAITTRLKIMSGMDIAEKRIPQDGRIQIRMGDRDIDFRVNSLPSIFGESIVMRLLDKSNVILGLEQIGFLPDNVKLFEELIRRPNGIILITGPTGSGKTTTLYSALSTLNNVDTKIITVENPVEYQIEGINQAQVNEEIGLTFSAILRAMLRQAPDVILVGEIRDSETAEIAISSALTGHLVFSTLHTNDAPAAATRLIEMGVKPFLVASAVQAVLAQRLVRMICKDCKSAYQAEPEIISSFGYDPDQYKEAVFYKGEGCDSCNFTGYRGRSAIFETWVLTEETRDLILRRSPSERIREKAREQGMRTLREDGWQKILRGDTTLAEVLRITAAYEN